MNNQNFKILNSNELMEIQGGGGIGTLIKLGKKIYDKAKTHVDDFVAGWNEA